MTMGIACGTVPETEGAASAAADHDPADGLPSEEQRLANIRELITAIPALMEIIVLIMQHFRYKSKYIILF